MYRFVALTLAVSGCADILDEPDPYPLERAFEAASLADAGDDVALMAMALAGTNQPLGCPKTETVGATTIATGPCWNGSETVDGMLTIRNTRSILNKPVVYDPAQPSQLLIAETFRRDQALTVYEGTIEWNRAALTADVSLAKTERHVRSILQLHLVCDADLLCKPRESSLSVDGLGTFAIDGAWSLQRPAAGGTLVLRGPEQIEFDMGTHDSRGCVPYLVIGGPSGAACSSTNQYFTMFSDFTF